MPEGVIDVIPVDLVVASILATAARGPHQRAIRRAQPDIIQIASGSANPFKYGQMVDLVQAYFTKTRSTTRTSPSRCLTGPSPAAAG